MSVHFTHCFPVPGPIIYGTVMTIPKMQGKFYEWVLLPKSLLTEVEYSWILFARVNLVTSEELRRGHQQQHDITLEKNQK